MRSSKTRPKKHSLASELLGGSPHSASQKKKQTPKQKKAPKKEADIKEDSGAEDETDDTGLTSSEPASRKTKQVQLHLDAGQKDIGPKICPTCHVVCVFLKSILP